MNHNMGNEKTIVEPVFNDIDLEISSPINEPPPPYNENDSQNVKQIYPTISLQPPQNKNNEVHPVPVFTNQIQPTTIVRGKCCHKKCCREDLSLYSKTFFCKQCNTNVQSTLSYEKGKRYNRRLLLLIVISILCPIFIICLIMLLFSKRYKDITHRCPYCHTTLGIHNV